MDEPLSLADLAARTKESFRKRFQREPSVVAAAPGRVNIIGEHTDYNDGFVLPMAIDRYTVIAADPAPQGRDSVTLHSSTVDDAQEFPIATQDRSALPVWAKYVACVLDHCAGYGLDAPAFDAAVDSTVPLGGGLSSSAALEVATATLVEALTDSEIDPIAKGLLCQKAEHQVGVPCGIMDQFSSVLCQEGHLMLLDCRSQQPRMVRLADSSVTILIINTNVKHELTGGEYAERRQQCEEAATSLGVNSLRDATIDLLETKKSALDDVHYRRARHVIGEIARTTAAAEACEGGNWSEVGDLMYKSHTSLRDDYEVSCKELDVLVAAAEHLGSGQGVYGSRMTGGGFGGCTVSLVKSEAVCDVAGAICREYLDKTGIEATAFATPPAQGAMVLTNESTG